jgi:lipoate-protein ligase A
VGFERRRGSSSDLHAADPEELLADRPSVVVLMEPTDRAIVLGSSQPDSLIYREAAVAAGFAVARRRSGGGIVVTGRDDAVWVDVLLAPRHHRTRADVDRAAVEVGSAWRDALLSLSDVGSAEDSGLEVHSGASLHRDAGRILCFGGLGSGEVSLRGAKLVGISQRRARWGARFQCQVQLRWAPEQWLHLVRPGPDAPADLLPLTVATITPPPSGPEGLPGRIAAAVATALDS